MTPSQKLTLNELKTYLSYESLSGEFTRLRNHKRADTPMNTGYQRVRLKVGENSYEMLAHRLAWLFSTGAWPTHEIDHINGNRSDNSILNLRDVTHRENAKNTRLRKSSTSGFHGVTRHQRGWKVEIASKYVGYTSCLGRAIDMRKAVEVKEGYHKNHGRP